jgi:hypothetical protein
MMVEQAPSIADVATRTAIDADRLCGVLVWRGVPGAV